VFDRVTIRVSDRSASELFYDTVLDVLGVERTDEGPPRTAWRQFAIAPAGEVHPVTRRLHVGFHAPSRVKVDEFWQTGVDAGYRDDGEPGPRPQYSADYYGAFLLDPDGNSAEAVHNRSDRRGVIDHLWLRVAELGASRAFYATLAPYTRFEPRHRDGDRVHIAGPDGSFTVVLGPPSEHVHMAFPASDDAAVDAFHDAATRAGYRDAGGPGFDALDDGRYAACVLDPDGNTIALVSA
jgi:catechol 2,3-dioxygenase-like lactoylglutathione lyase family enzyme